MEDLKKKTKRIFEEYLYHSSTRFKFIIDYTNYYIHLDENKLRLEDFTDFGNSYISKPEKNKGYYVLESDKIIEIKKYEKYLSECRYIEEIFETVNSLKLISRKYLILAILFKNDYALKKKLGFINEQKSTYYYHYSNALLDYVDQSFFFHDIDNKR